MVKVDSNGNFIKDTNTMTHVDKNGNFVYTPVSGRTTTTTTKKKKKNEWINTSAFDDGYQPFDILRTISGTGADIYQDLTKGAVGIGESFGDFLINTASGGVEAIGQKDAANKMREFAQKDLFEDLGVYDSMTSLNGFGITNAILNGNIDSLNPFDKEAKKRNIEAIEEGSVLGEKADNISQGVGQLIGQAGLTTMGIPWQLTAFTTSAGNEMNNAFKNNATYGQALMSGIISGAVEVGSEYIGGGANKLLGMTSLGSKAIEKLGSKISNKLVARLTKLGFDMAGEGLEEVISGYGQAIGQKLTYMSDKEINELYSNEDALEEFISGALVSGIANVPGNIQSAARGENAWSGRTENEQKVYDSVLQERINEQQKDGKKLTNKEINAIEEQLQKDMSKGRVSVSQIESALGLGERVNNLIHDAEVRKGQQLTQEEIDAIQNEENEKYLNDISKDTMLQNSYYENSQRSKGFDFDAKKYKGKQLEIVQKAKDSGVLNNTGATHEFVDFISKIASDKNIDFDFTNNEKLKESGFAVDGADVNGYVTKDGITLNINSNKALNSVVGHEITHILEDTDFYDTLQESLQKYVGTQTWNKKVKELTELYKDVEGAEATKELTADLIGDYLFTDEDFINHLTQDRNLFEKIFDEIKYLVKQVTTGSKEERELNKIKKIFEKAYNQNIVKNAKQESDVVKLSLSKNALQDVASIVTETQQYSLINKEQFAKLKDNTPQQLVDLGAKDLPMLERRGHVRENILTEEEARKLGYSTKGKHYHGLGVKTYLDIIDSMDNPVAIYEYTDEPGHYIIETPVKNGNTNVIVPIELEQKGKYNDLYIDYNKIKTTFSPNDYYMNNLVKKGKIKEVFTQADVGQIPLDTNNVQQNNNNVKYSLSPSGEMVDNSTGEKVELDASNTGNTGTLMAIHNLNEDKLNGVLELGGFPVPSIAITNPNLINHKQFGDISVIFDKNTINPEMEANEVYDRDVWSPTFPQVEYELNEDGIEKVAKDLGIEEWRLRDAAEDNSKPEYLVERLLREEKLIDKYIEDNNIEYETAYKDAETKIDMHQRGEKIRQFIIDNDFDFKKLYKDSKLQKEYFDLIKEYYDNSSFPQAVKENLYNEKITQLKDYIDAQKGAGDLEPVWKLKRYQDDFDLIKSGDNKVIDEWQTEKNKKEAAINNGIEDYLKNEIKDVYGEKGIRNDREIFTPSGNRRSFWQLHDEYNLENIVDALTKGETTGTQSWFAGFGQIQANMSNRFNSIADIKANENRLTSLAENNEVLEEARNNIENDIDEIVARNDTDSMIVSELLADFARGDLTIDNFKKLTRNDYQTTQNVPDSLINKIIDDMNNLKNLPTDYFEAKPQRAVGLDEIQQVVIPSNSSQELRDRLQEMGIPFTEYNPEVEGDRQRVINQFDDLKFSLSQQGEIAPTGNYNVYGKDIALQEEIAPVKEDLSRLNTEIAAIREDYNRQADEIKSQIQELKDLRENLFTESVINNDVIPVETQATQVEETPSYQSSTIALDNKALSKYKNYFKTEFGVKGRQLNQAMEGIKELSENPNLTKNDVYNYIKDNFGKEETRIMNDNINEAQSELRNTPIGVDEEVKKEMAYTFDTYGKFRKQNFGKLKLVEYNGYNGVDQVYEVLSSEYPDLFPEDIINPADQLRQIHEIANSDKYNSYFEDLPEQAIRDYSDELYGMIQEYRQDTLKNLVEAPIPQDYFESIAPYEEENNDVNIDDEIKSLEQKLNGLENLKGMDILNAKRRFDEITNPEDVAQIEKDTANILDLIYQQEQRRNGNVEIAKPIIAKEKSSLRRGIDTLKTMFINKNAEIDNLAKETGNKNIKFAGDMLNNYVAEAQNDIQVAQTNNEGKAIGKALNQLFEPAKQKGLETILNDYLINYSNIDRWNNNKGSKTPLDVSERIVADYEARYPELKEWAKDIWQYGKNYLTNMHDAGLINDAIYNYLGEKYQHYVPYISDSNTFDATIDELSELKARGIKKAVGGATELTPIEDALTRYTFAHKRALRTNELYKEIVNQLYTEADKSNPPAQDRLEDYTNLNNNLYRDDTGNNYLTAFIDGQEKSVKVSDDLFKSLRNDMETRIKDYEKRLSIITKPLQTIGKARRNILTSLSPSFMITNPVKDIQDAVLNSKHTKQMIKNYLPAIKELWSDSTPEVRQFKALYGAGNTMGQYDAESGLYNPKKGNKNNNFLEGLVKVNEVMELAPRFAEFKASLQAGESYQEAMYNAREITTNFSRGGVITKALNRNGFTFLNANVQGLDKFIRNFSGENGAKGIANSLIKAVIFGVAPAIFNELAFGGGDDKDEDYDVLPDYIKDNYYLIKTGDGSFVRIPKGRMLSVFGSAARRTLELAEGEEDAFEGFLENANNQVGISSPEESNIFAPLLQAYGSENGENWYGGDIVPSRLQDKPKNEQYDASTDKFSIWLSNTEIGKKLGLSPYKVNYVLDQYSGGIGDIVLPMITDEAQSEGGLLAPVVDKFTADSTTDNKYVSDFYTKNDELKVQSNSSKATDLDKVKNQYMYNVSSEMAKLYAERRAVQSNNSLTKAEKYKKSQAIKDEINKLAKEGLDNYDSAKITGDYASVGNEEFYKNAKGKWTTIDDDTKEEINSLGLTNLEKDSYFNAKNDIYTTTQEYKDKLENATESQKATLNANKKKTIINTIKNSGLTDEAKANLYDKSYASTDTLNAILDIGINFDSYLDLEAQNFTADKDANGKSINGSKKAKVYNYINNMNMSYDDKIMLAKLYYKTDNTYNQEIINSLNRNPSIDYQEMKQILKSMGMNIDDYGNITW